MKRNNNFHIYILAVFFLFPLACSKMGTSLPPPPPSPCSFVSIGVSGSATNPSVNGATDGRIVATATGATGITYNINNGSFQSSGSFNNLVAGSYTVTARSPEGCTGSVVFELVNPAIQCVGVNISVSLTATSNVPCEPNRGSIVAAASGGTAPYMYSIGSSAFQSANNFINLASGSHIITVKDANGCTGSGSTTVTTLPTGALFAQVKSLLQYNCISCHSNTSAQGGISFSVDCNIVDYKDRIKARAVDGVPSPMPQNGLLSASDRQKITNWINAGGRMSD